MDRLNKIYTLTDCYDSPLVFDTKDAYAKYSYTLKRVENEQLCLSISGRLSFRLKLPEVLYITELVEEKALVLSTYPLSDSSIKTSVIDDVNPGNKYPHKHKLAFFPIDSLKADITSMLSKLCFDVTFTNDPEKNIVLLTFYRPIIDNVQREPTIEEIIFSKMMAEEPTIEKPPRRKISMMKKKGQHNG